MRIAFLFFVLASIGCSHRTVTSSTTLGGTVPITRGATPESFATRWDVSAGGAIETGSVQGHAGTTSVLANGEAEASIGVRPARVFALRLGGEMQFAPMPLVVGRGQRPVQSVLGGGTLTASGLAVEDPVYTLEIGGSLGVGAMPVVRQLYVTETSTSSCFWSCSPYSTPTTTTRMFTEREESMQAWFRITAHALFSFHALEWLDVTLGATIGNQPLASGMAFVAIPSFALVMHATDGTGVVLSVEQPVGTMGWQPLPIASLSLRLGFGGFGS